MDNYLQKLTSVFEGAYSQAAYGKGKERHAGDLPFQHQPMQQISNLLGSTNGMAFQAVKKITEARKLPQLERRVRELHGALNYCAGIIISGQARNGGLYPVATQLGSITPSDDYQCLADVYQAALSLYQLDGESVITTESGLPLQLSVARLLGTAQGLYQCAVENLLIALDHECPACDYRDGFHEAMLLAMCDIADIIIAEEGASKDIETAKPVGIEASIAEAACATADNYTEYQISH